MFLHGLAHVQTEWLCVVSFFSFLCTQILDTKRWYNKHLCALRDRKLEIVDTVRIVREDRIRY